MNGAPDWQDGECCFRCRTQFTLVARKHHCRNCGNIFCAKCSSQQIPLPKLNIEKNVRVCDTCYEKLVGKSNDPLALALDTKDNEKTKPKTTNSKSSASSSNNKQAASASAPSEQELKEEEELQLALALSLSETPTKVSFPEICHYEEPKKTVTKDPAPETMAISNKSVANQPSTSNGYGTQRVETTKPESTTAASNYPAVSQPQVQPMVVVPPQPIDYHIPERDREVFRFVGDVQANLEVFNNRLESCKLRSRPVANDAAIQSLFIKLNSEVQPKLAEYIKTYDNERADYERIQDKLSQIADARAALDALREEHQEKMREQAAEADRLRQTQLATKLEAMRQKKSQMMQYQRELALQRIKEQELQQQSPQQHQQQYQSTTTQGYQVPPVTAPQDAFMAQPIANHMHQEWHHHQVPQEQHYSQVQQTSYVPSQQHYSATSSHATHVPQNQPQHYVSAPHAQPSTAAPVQAPLPPPPNIDRASIAQLERQFLPPPKPDEDAPLISFDD